MTMNDPLTLPVSAVPALSPFRFTRTEAQTVAAFYRNVFIEDDQITHFRVAVREEGGNLIWREWDFSPNGGSAMNTWIARYGIPNEKGVI
ncbi:MAG TPA: DUF905 family protein [Scandinavium sp.]